MEVLLSVWILRPFPVFLAFLPLSLLVALGFPVGVAKLQ